MWGFWFFFFFANYIYTNIPCHLPTIYIISHICFPVPPQGAEIQGPLQPFTCSRDYYIQCKVWGSNPPAKIEWFRGTSPNHGLRPLKAHNQTVTQGGNVTVSWLHYQPKAGHHHQTLICRGSNDDLMTATSRTVEDYHRMEIFCESNNNSKTSSATL